MKYYTKSSLSHRIASGKLDKRTVFRWLKRISHHVLKSRARYQSVLKAKTQRKIRLKRHFPLIVLFLSLTGCMGIYEGGFECPAGTGVGCKSISEVNTMVDRSQLPGIREQMAGMRNQESETGSYDHGLADSLLLRSDSQQIWYAPLMNQLREKASCPVLIDEELRLEAPKGCTEEDGSLAI